MRRLVSLALLAVLGWTALGPTAEPLRSPLRNIPAQADLVIEIPRPTDLMAAVQDLDLASRLQTFSAAREALAGTNVRRFQQLVSYLERELGAPWPQLLERIAGGGAALGVKLGPNPAPTLLVLQGTDAKLLPKLLDVVARIAEQEIARQDGKDKVERGEFEGAQGLKIGNDFHALAVGSTLLLSNRAEVLRLTYSMIRDGGKSAADRPEVAAANKLLPADALARIWLDLETVKKAPGAKPLYQQPRDDGNLTFLVGGYLDVLGRSPWMTAGLLREPNGAKLAIRLPAGRDGMGPDRALHVPPEGQPGSRPLLEPKGVLYSDSSYQDYSRIWEDRGKLFNEKQKSALERFDQTSGRFLSGMRMSKLVNQVGAYHRVVVAHQPSVPYAVKPKQPLPAFAFVVEMREPEKFSKAMEAVLRGAALLALTQVKLKLVEEQHAGCDLVGWRFDDTAPFPRDVNDLRFNFSPCFTRVGNQFVVCSTLELCRELVELLKKEDASASVPQTSRTRVYANGVADVLATAEDAILAQTILDQAMPLEEAGTQVRAFLAMIREMGSLGMEADFQAREFRYDVRIGK